MAIAKKLETPAGARRRLQILSPADRRVIGEIECMGSEDVHGALARARKAQPAWGKASLQHRIEVMQHWAVQLQEHCAALVAADSIDTGYGQISKVAPHMVINAINRTCAVAPMLFERIKRSGTSPGA